MRQKFKLPFTSSLQNFGLSSLIVSGLSSELNKGRKERGAVEKKLISLQESHTSLQAQFGQLVEESAQQVSITEHQSALNEMHRSDHDQ